MLIFVDLLIFVEHVNIIRLTYFQDIYVQPFFVSEIPNQT